MASRPIDEKIVKLGVDNADFKSKLIESLRSLASFGNALKSVDGGNLNSVSSAASASAKSIDEIGNSAETSKSKFSILAGAASVALGNIASKALSSGMSVVKSLTIDPVMNGYKEYTEKLSAIQVMKSNTTASMDEINSSLAELNAYSDKTIYKFSDMTNAVGQMTTAGVGLKDSVTATTGAFNLAAASGMDTVKANSMVQFGLTQAMTKGFLGVQDLVSFGAAGGKKFQDMAHSVADELGIGYDKSVSFRDSLQSGWLNTQVLTETMRRFGQDKSMLEKANEAHSFGEAMGAIGEAAGSGWASVWEALIGNYDQATELWTKFQTSASNAVQAPLKGLAELAKAFVSFGGRTAIIDIVATAFKSLTGVISSISKAWSEAFPNTVADSGKLFANIFKLLADAIKIILPPLQLIGPAFQIFFGVLSIGFNIIKLILTPLTTLFRLFTKGSNLENTVNKFTDWSKVLGKVSAALSNFFLAISYGFAIADKVISNGTTNFVKAIINTIKSVVELVKHFSNFTQILYGLTNPFVLVARAANIGTQGITPFMAVIGLVKAVIDVFRSSLKYLGDTIKNIGAGFKAFFGQMTFAFAPLTKLKDHFKEVSPEFSKMSDGLGVVGKAMQPFVKFVINLISHLNDMSKYLSTSGGAFVNFSVYMTIAGQKVRDFITNMVDAFNGSKVVTAARQLGKDIVDGLTIGVKNQTLDLFAFIKPALDGFIKSVKELFDIHSPSRVMQEIGKNIIDGLTLGLTQAVHDLPNFFGKVGGVLKGLGGIVVKAFQAIPGAVKFVIDAFGNLVKMIAPYSQALGQIFSAIGEMVSGFLNNLNTPAALKGGIIVALVGWIHALNKADGPGIISKILHPIKTLKDILKEKFGDGGGMLDQVKNTLKSYQREIKTRMLVDIAAAIGILAGAMWILSTIPGDKLITASVGMATAAGSLAIMFKTLSGVADASNTIDVVKITTTVVGISIALGIMASAVTKMSSMDPAGAAVAVAAMGGLLLELSLAMQKGFSMNPEQELVKVTSLIVITLALSKLAKSLEGLSKLSWNEMAVGLVGMGAVVGMLTIVVNSMKMTNEQSIVGFTGLAFALNLAMGPVIVLGLLPWGVTLRGIGMMALTLTAMSGINILLNKFGGSKGSLGLIGMVTALNLAMVPIIALGLLPWEVTLRGIGFMTLALAGLAGVNILMTKFGGGSGSIGMVVMAAALNMIIAPITILGTLPWQVVAAGLLAVTIALGVFVGAGALSQLVLPGMLALAAVLSSFSLASLSFGVGVTMVVTAIAILAGIIVSQGVKIVQSLGDMLKAIGNLGPVLGTAIGTLIGGLISGLASAIANNFGSIVQSATQIIEALVQGILGASDTLIGGIITLLNQLLDAILSEIPVIAVKIGNGILDLMNTLALFIQNNTAAILNAVSNVMQAVITLITTALGDMLGKIPGIGGKLKKDVIDAGKSASDGLADTFPPGMQAATAKGAEEAIKGLSGKSGAMREQALQLAMNAKDGASQISTFLSLLGVQGGDEFVNGIKSGAIPAQQAGDLLKQMAKAGASNGSLEEMAKAMGGTYANGVFTPDTAQKTADAAKKLPQTAADNAKPTDGQKTDVQAALAGLAGSGVAGVQSKVTDAGKAGDDVTSAANNALSKVTDHSGAGSATAGSKVAGVNSQRDAASGAGSSITNNVSNALAKTKNHSGEGSAEAGSKVAGVNSQRGAASGAGSSITNNVSTTLARIKNHSGAGSAEASSKVAGVNSQRGAASGAAAGVNSALNPLGNTRDFSGAGSATGRSKARGVDSARGHMDGAVSNLNSATDALGQNKDYSSSGRSIGDSFANGISSAMDSVGRAASGLMDWAKSFFPHSPAPRGPFSGAGWTFIRTSGETIVKSFAEGISGSVNQINPATTTLMQTVHDAINSVNNDLSNNGVFTPTITPVVDMKNVNNLDLSSFDSLGTISGGSFLTKVQYENMNQNQQQISQTNSLVSELQSGFTTLHESLDTLNNLNDGQLQVLQNQPSPDVYMDGTMVTDTLAAKMVKAQNDYNNTMAYIGGIQQNL